MTPHILVAEDEDSLATLLNYNLEKEGYAVAVAADGEDALMMINEKLPGCRGSRSAAGCGRGPRPATSRSSC
jgi:DNA-binding NtrC family response regulator